MNKTELHTILVGKTQIVTVDGVEENHLIITGSDVQSAGISTLFSTYLGADQLTIRLTAPITLEELTANGDLIGGTFDTLKTKVSFGVNASGAANCLLQAFPDTFWRFSDAYPSLAGSLFDHISFASETVLNLSSEEIVLGSETFTEGLHFQAQLLGQDFMEPLLWLLGNPSFLSLEGEIEMNGELPECRLSMEVKSKIEVGFFKLPFVRLSLLSEGDGNGGSEAQISLETELDFEDGANNTKIPLKALFQNPALSFLLFADLNDLLDSAFDSLASLVNDMDIQTLIPSGFSIGDVIQLENVVLQILPKEKKLHSVSLAIQSAQPWELVSDLLTLETINLAIKLDDPMGEAELSMALMGEMSIDNTI